MNIKQIIIVSIFFLLIPCQATLYKVNDKVIFTYHKEKVIGVLKKIKKTKILVENNGCTMGYKRRKLSLKDRAQFYNEDEKRYEAILKKHKKIKLDKVQTLEKSPYKYLKKPISEKRFKKLYNYFQNKLYINPKGKVVDLTINSPKTKNMPLKPKEGDTGKISGKIFQNIPIKKILLSVKVLSYYYPPVGSFSPSNLAQNINTRTVSGSTNYLYCIKNLNRDSFITGRDFSCVAIMTGAYQYRTVMGGSRTVPLLEALRQISEDDFKSYIAKGAKLYSFKEIPAETKICEKCKGWGKIRESKKSLSYVKCPRCGGKKKIIIGKIKYIKSPILK